VRRFRKGLLVAIALVALGRRDAHAICRVVVEEGSIPPVIVPQQSVMFVLRHDVPIGPGCMGPPDMGAMGDLGADTDGGGSNDGGPDDDGGDDGGDDAGGAPDGGEVFDLGPPGDLSPPCMQRRGDAVTMIVQPHFSTGKGGSSFAFLMVTPRLPTVALASNWLFENLAKTTAPLIVTKEKEIEDESLGYKCHDPYYSNGSSGGCGGGSYQPQSTWSGDFDLGGVVEVSDAGLPDSPTILGGYEIAVLPTPELDAVRGWLDDHLYATQPDDLAALSPYHDKGWVVTAVRVRTDRHVLDAALAPLSFTWEGREVRLPVAVSRMPQGGDEPVTVYVLGDGRYDFPSGGHVSYAEPASGGFLTRNDLTVSLAALPAADPIAARRSGDSQYRDQTVVWREVRVPSSKCPAKDTSIGCSCRVAGVSDGTVTIALSAIALLVARIRRRRKP
jgi:MYXO-CTERM domain-containing protein